jgi:hypothetical protein
MIMLIELNDESQKVRAVSGSEGLGNRVDVTA